MCQTANFNFSTVNKEQLLVKRSYAVPGSVQSHVRRGRGREHTDSVHDMSLPAHEEHHQRVPGQLGFCGLAPDTDLHPCEGEFGLVHSGGDMLTLMVITKYHHMKSIQTCSPPKEVEPIPEHPGSRQFVCMSVTF